MASRTRDTAPYPSPSPKLFDENIPRLEDDDLRDAYDSQFRINQRLRRWGIEIADILNALELGDWDPSTKVVWVGDGADADYDNIQEALINISPSSADPRLIIVFPGTYFDRLYIPSHTSIYGLGARGQVKIRYAANNGEKMIEGGSTSIRLGNLDIRQTSSTATGTGVIDLNTTDVTLDTLYVENAATDADSEVVVIENSSQSVGKNVTIRHTHFKGNNAARHTTVTTRLDDIIFTDVWPFNDYFESWPLGVECQNLAEDAGGFNFAVNSFQDSGDTNSPFGDSYLQQIHAHGLGAGSTGQILSGAEADAATAVSLSTWVYYAGWAFSGVGTMTVKYQDIMSVANIGASYKGLHLVLNWEDRTFCALHGSTDPNYAGCLVAKSRTRVSPKRWYRLDAAYDKVSGDLCLWINGELAAYANKPKSYVYAGNTQRVDMALHTNSATSAALCHNMGFSEIAVANGWINPWEFVINGKQDISTLRLSSKWDENTDQNRIVLNDVLVENNKPNNNIIIGNSKFNLTGVISELSEANNESRNIVVRNDTNDYNVHSFTGVTSLFGEYSLVFDTPRSRITAGRGGYYGNRPTFIPPTDMPNPHFEEDWTQRPSEGPIAAHEVFLGSYLGDVNALYHGEIDGTGFLYPQGDLPKSFEDIIAEEITARNISVEESFAKDEDYDTDYFGVMPLPTRRYMGEIPYAGQYWFSRDVVSELSGNIFRRHPGQRPCVIPGTDDELTAPSSWDIENEDWEDITDWTNSTGGTGNLTEDPSGQLRSWAGEQDGTDAYRYKYKDSLITSDPSYTIDCYMKFDVLEAHDDVENVDHGALLLSYNGVRTPGWQLYTDEIWEMGSGGAWIKLANLTTALNNSDWYTVRMKVLNSGASNGDVIFYIKNHTTGNIETITGNAARANAGSNGRVLLGVKNNTLTPVTTEAHWDFTKITSENVSVTTGSAGSVEEEIPAADLNLLYEDVVDGTGFITPESSLKSFNNIYAEEMNPRVLDVQEHLYANGFVQTNDVDPEGFIYPYDAQKFVVRDDPGAYDFAVGNFTTDATWRTLDLSSIVPRSAKAVLVKLALKDGAINSTFQLRRFGDSAAYTAQKSTQVANQTVRTTMFVPISGQKCQYKGDAVAFTTINLMILGWWL